MISPWAMLGRFQWQELPATLTSVVLGEGAP